MSGTVLQGQQKGIIPANATLLQPASGYYMLYNAMWTLDQGASLAALQDEVAAIQGLDNTLVSQIATLQGQVATLQGQVTTLQGQTASLQAQITVVNGRLTAAGIP